MYIMHSEYGGTGKVKTRIVCTRRYYPISTENNGENAKF